MNSNSKNNPNDCNVQIHQNVEFIYYNLLANGIFTLHRERKHDSHTIPWNAVYAINQEKQHQE